ncbi:MULTISPECIES: hypothetical protein [Burkholderia]|uniref:Uncharacterized protein n=1 Tax=Burkholderia theae TaxID=3143496 RepID=A0ABU9WBZ8_9BURK
MEHIQILFSFIALPEIVIKRSIKLTGEAVRGIRESLRAGSDEIDACLRIGFAGITVPRRCQYPLRIVSDIKTPRGIMRRIS